MITSQELIKGYFGHPFPGSDGNRAITVVSNYRALRNHADAETGRQDGDRGKRHSWLGAAAYLILLDQLGTCFGPGPVGSEKRVVGILESRGRMTTIDSKALYALRCSFAHDFGLQNKGEKGPGRVDPDLRRHFGLCADVLSQIVEQPNTPWDGDPATISRDTQTRVDIALVGDKVCEICDELERDALSGTLALMIGLDEFRTRFFWGV